MMVFSLAKAVAVVLMSVYQRSVIDVSTDDVNTQMLKLIAHIRTGLRPRLSMSSAFLRMFFLPNRLVILLRIAHFDK